MIVSDSGTHPAPVNTLGIVHIIMNLSVRTSNWIPNVAFLPCTALSSSILSSVIFVLKIAAQIEQICYFVFYKKDVFLH